MTELTKATTTAVATKMDEDFAFASTAEQSLGKNDVLIPKILLMQGQSPKVLDGSLSFGDITNTLDWSVMGNSQTAKKEAKNIPFLPFHWEKYWINKVQSGQKWAFESLEKITPETESLDPYEEWNGQDGRLRKRVYLHLFYVLLEGQPIPYTIGFRGASKTTGDNLVTQMYIINTQRQAKEAHLRSIMGRWFNLSSILKSKDDSTFAIYEISPLRDASLDEAKKALKWNKDVRSGTAQADHSDLSGEGDTSYSEEGEF